MAELMPALLAEQERLMPLLEHLLGQAALWVDPPVAGGEGAGAGLQFATEPATAPLPMTRPAPAANAAVAAGGPGLSVLSPQPVTTGPGTPGSSLVAGTWMEAVAGAETATPTALVPAQPPAAGNPSASGAALPPTLPVASLGRLRERAGARLAIRSRSAAFMAGTAPGVAAMPFAALAAAAAAPFDPGTPSVATTAPGMPAGTAVAVETAPPPFALPMTAAAPAGRPVGSLAAWAAAATTTSPGLPGDALEERLADILERAAAEAGISLP